MWIKYLKKAVTFHERYLPSSRCRNAAWGGSAFTIKGGYTWSDILDKAARRNVVVVGGGTPVRQCFFTIV